MKFEVQYRDCIKMNRDKIGTQTCYVHHEILIGYVDNIVRPFVI